MEKLKNKKIGRPKYEPNIEQLQELYSEIRKGNITNEMRLADKLGIHKTLWYQLKRKYEKMEVKLNV